MNEGFETWFVEETSVKESRVVGTIKLLAAPCIKMKSITETVVSC